MVTQNLNQIAVKGRENRAKGGKNVGESFLPIFIRPKNDTRQTAKTPLAVEERRAFSSGQIEERG